jgi:hypothetical protein
VNVLALYDIHGNIDALEAVPAGAPDDMPAVTAALSARELGAERAGVLGELPLETGDVVHASSHETRT